MRTWLLICSILSMGTLSWSQASYKVSGVILDESREPLYGAHILLSPGDEVASTNESGHFEFEKINGGLYSIRISYVGYTSKNLEVEVNRDVHIELELVPGQVLTDEIVVQALRANVNTGTTYENIDKQRIEKRNTGQELPFLLQMTPSVVVTSDAGQGVGHTGIRIRGSDATRINATINGIPYNDAESQGTFWLNMPDFASSVESIQVQRGVGTSTNGGGAFGASLNINTNSLTKDPYINLNNSAGSFGTFKNTIRLGTGLMKDQFVLDARLSRIKSDGYIDRAFSDLKSLYVSGGWYMENKILRFNLISGNQKSYQSWNGIPENILETNRTYNEFTYPDQTDNYTQTHFQVHWSQQLKKDWNWSLSLNYTPGKGYYEEYKENQSFEDYGMKPLNIVDTVIQTTDLVRQRWLDNQFYGLTAHTHWDASNQLGFTLGGAFFQYTGDHFGEITWARYASDSNADKHYYFNDALKNDGNAYLKTTWKTGSSSVFIDLQTRYVYYSFLGLDRNGKSVQQDDHLTFFNPKIGYTHFINNRSQFYASVAKASREPNRSDYKESTPESRPVAEELYNLETGYRLNGTKHQFTGNVYYMYYYNQLVLTGQINDVGNYVRSNDVGNYVRSNVKKSYRLGVELSDTYAFSTRWNVGGTLAWSMNKIPEYNEYLDIYNPDFIYQGQEKVVHKNTDIAFSPSLIGGISLAYSPIDFLAFTWESKYVSRQYLDNTSSKERSIDPFSFSNVRVALNKKLFSLENVILALDFKNVFDAMYESNGYTFGYIYDGNRSDFNYYYPQAGFHFMVSLNIDF